MASIPLGYIQLEDAFQEALDTLEDYQALLAAPAVELPTLDPEYITYDTSACDHARYRVELRMREALADGELRALVVDPLVGVSELTGREKWRAGFDGFGLETFIEPAINPGPDTGGLPVMLEAASFREWLNAAKLEKGLGPHARAGRSESEKTKVIPAQRRTRSGAKKRAAIAALRLIKARCKQYAAKGELPRAINAAAIFLKAKLGDDVEWGTQTIRKVISGRHPLVNDLVKNGQAEAFWKEHW
jgi:hypothetical protein